MLFDSSGEWGMKEGRRSITIGIDNGLLAEALVSGGGGVGGNGEVDVASARVDGDGALLEDGDQGGAASLVTGQGLFGLLSRDCGESKGGDDGGEGEGTHAGMNVWRKRKEGEAEKRSRWRDGGRGEWDRWDG